MDYITALEVAVAAASKGVPLSFADLLVLAHAYRAVKDAGKLDLAGMIKVGTLKQTVKAARNALDTIDSLLNDPAQGPKVEGLLGSLAI